ncbi:MAG: Mur ligase family protein [Candidatus Adlerbacteria bacterium]|nr:Mur ligase family protein [Candidatus Adlerbacteria bacterium]
MRTLFKKCIVYVLTLEARLVVRKYKPRIVAVTGSVGKTSTKDAIYSVLAENAHVRKSDKSFNSEVGLPLTILGCPNAWSNPLRWLQNIVDGLILIIFKTTYPEWLVLEVGADRPGDISSLAAWLPVDIAVITRLPEVPVHVEFFDSADAVVAEKASLINALKKDGTLVVYADDNRRDVLVQKAQARGVRIVTFGLLDTADVYASGFSVVREEGGNNWPIGMESHITAGGISAPVSTLGILGSHMVLPLVAAAAVGSAVGKTLPEIAEALSHYTPPHGRMRLLPGIKDTRIIDDTYNSSPVAVVAALDALKLIAPRGRVIAVFADMLELGRHSVEEHRKIGAYAAGIVDILVTVGFRARDAANGALDAGLADGNIFQYEDAEKAGEELAAMLAPGDVVLVKGSQSMRMEKTVEHVMLNPERAGELLVRQELNWKNR